jgi:hypothetical protein
MMLLRLAFPLRVVAAITAGVVLMTLTGGRL